MDENPGHGVITGLNDTGDKHIVVNIFLTFVKIQNCSSRILRGPEKMIY